MSVTLPTPPAPPADAVPPLPADVRAFADRHNLAEHLPTTFRLIREEFDPVGEVAMRVRDDSEVEGHTSLVLNVPVRGDVSSVLDRYYRYLERWVPVTPPDARMRLTVIWTFQP
ncbi:MAG: hypothetical protein C0501_08710 [Isosphaera sp.]|nr:hypothetical protein [Isosphaera sp.]